MQLSEVRRKIVVESQTVGVDDTTRKLGGLGKAQDEVGKASERSARSTLVLDNAMMKANASLQMQVRQQALYEQALADYQRSQQMNLQLQQQLVANDNTVRSVERTSLAMKAMSYITEKALEEAAKGILSHVAASIAWGAVLSRLAIGLGTVYVAYKLLRTGIDLVSDAWELGGKKLEEYVDLAKKAAAVDLSTDFYQRITKSATDAKLPVDDLSKALEKLQDVSKEKLGGSDLQNQLNKHLKAGNIQGNAGIGDLAGANTSEERFRAIVRLIDDAMQKGQRLAALDLANTAFGPTITENLRKNSDYLKDMQAKAEQIAATDLVSSADVGRAQDLQRRYDAAVALLETRWHPIQELLVHAGINMRAAWVGIVESIASAVDWATKLVMKLGDAPPWFQKKMGEGSQWLMDTLTTPESRAAAGIVPVTQGEVTREAATKKLAAELLNLNAVQSAGAQSLAVYDGVIKDTSKSLDDQKKSTEAAKSAMSAAMDGIEKYIQTTNAAAKSVDAGVHEQEKAKTIATLTAAAMRDGKTDLAQYAAEWEALGNRAGDAARNLALARVQSQIKFDRETIGLSQEDVQIAGQLRKLYPDVATALGSTEAAQMRLNNQMREGRDIAGGFASDLVGGLLRGEDAMKSMTSAASNMVQKLSSSNLNRFMQGGSVFGNQSLNSTAGGVGTASAGLAGYQSGNALTGALGGAMAGATFGPVGAAVGAIAGAVGGLIGAADQAEQKLEESKKRWKEMETQFIAFNLAADGIDLGPLTQQLSSLHSSFMTLVYAAADAEDWVAVVRLQTSYMKGIYRTVEEFANGAPTLTPLEAAVKSVNDEFTGLMDTLEFMGQLTPEISAKLQGGLIRRLEEVRRAADEAAAAADRQRALGFADQLFDLTNDTSTVAGQLAALERETARLREQEVKDGGQALVDLDALYFARRNKIIADFNQQAIDTEKRAAEERAAAMNSAARNILDYVNGLRGGANSTLSPQDRFNAAQSSYNAKLVLAQSGNVDAQSTLAQDFENYRSAARDLYGSTAQYQNLLNSGINALMNLPAVQQTSDPVLVVMRDVLTAINAGIATQATDAVLIGTIKTAIDNGNAAATAAALSTFFNRIDTNTSQSIDYAEMVAALTPVVTNTNGTVDEAATRAALNSMAGNTALRAMFTTLDTDNSGAITRLELIRAASQATDANTSATNGNAALTAARVNAVDNRIDQGNAKADTSNALLDSIRALQDISATQLTLLRTALNPPGLNIPVSAAVGNGTFINANLNNQMVEALNKIVFNTWAISRNTAFQIDVAARAVGVYGEGGLIGGRPHSQGGTRIEAELGEYMIRKSVVDQFGVSVFDQINAGRMPVTPMPVPIRAGNDNGDTRAMLAAIERLEREVTRLREDNNRGNTMIGRGVDAVGEGMAAANNLKAEEIKLMKRRA